MPDQPDQPDRPDPDDHEPDDHEVGGDDPVLPPELAAMFGQLGLGGDLPPELRAVLERLQTPEGMEELRRQAEAMLGDLGGSPFAAGFGAPFGAGMPGGPGTSGVGGAGAPTGPVDWSLATRVALQLVADDDRAPTPDEQARVRDAVQLAEHWLDVSPLPAPPDAGTVRVVSRQEWVNTAVQAMRPLVDPVARASTDAMIDLAREQFSQLGDVGGVDALDLPDELAPLKGLIEQFASSDPEALLRPVGAMLSGLQVGQVLGQLAQVLLGQYDLGIPTAPRAETVTIAANVADAFDGWDLDPTEVGIVLALHEAALRRLYHAIPWLEAHVHTLVARFAAGTVVDADRLDELTRELMSGVDADDPASLHDAMQRATRFRMSPTDEQRRILERLQGVVCLVGAWARHEVARAAADRLPSLERIAEVQRRRRATRGDGDDLLAGLLGLDLQPDDEQVGERFVRAVEDALGSQALRRALDHPENLPDAAELADPAAWLARMAADGEVPDDLSALFADLGDAPREASAEERLAGGGPRPDGGDTRPDDGGDTRPDDGGDTRPDDGGDTRPDDGDGGPDDDADGPDDGGSTETSGG